MSVPHKQADKNKAPSWESTRQADINKVPSQRQEQEAPLLQLDLFLLCARIVRVLPKARWTLYPQLDCIYGQSSYPAACLQLTCLRSSQRHRSAKSPSASHVGGRFAFSRSVAYPHEFLASGKQEQVASLVRFGLPFHPALLQFIWHRRGDDAHTLPNRFRYQFALLAAVYIYKIQSTIVTKRSIGNQVLL